MTPPIIGTWQVRVRDARPFTIHSDAYIELAVERLDADAGTDATAVVRVPAHAFSTQPEVGQQVRLTFLMGQVTKVEPVA
ncbi:MAG: hypothetical protein ACTHLN_11730 [Tepidisphaeraceae bacterium]